MGAGAARAGVGTRSQFPLPGSVQTFNRLQALWSRATCKTTWNLTEHLQCMSHTRCQAFPPSPGHLKIFSTNDSILMDKCLHDIGILYIKNRHTYKIFTDNKSLKIILKQFFNMCVILSIIR